MKAFLFDLDDTLYPEIEFVKSGFMAVSDYLHATYNHDPNLSFKQMLTIMERDGRGAVFDTLLEQLGLYSQERVITLLHIYRAHKPCISLYNDVLSTLKKLRAIGMQLGCITDGMASVQKNKLRALNLFSLLDILLCTDELGREYSKPSPLSFLVALEMMQISPKEAVYIADNIDKDFVGPNLLGMMTIQIKRHGVYSNDRDILPNSSYRPQFSVKNLKEGLSLINQ